jgi:hypothetical protein
MIEQLEIELENIKVTLSKMKKDTDEYKDLDKIRKSIYMKHYYIKNKDKVQSVQKKYREDEEIQKQIKERSKKHYEDNPEMRKKWLEENPDRIKEHQKKYYSKNKDKIIENAKTWNKDNKDLIADRRKQKHNKDKKTNLDVIRDNNK